MKPPEAIEVLADLLEGGGQYPPADRREAVRLGFEGLKAIMKLRHFPYPVEILELPGETPDES